MDVSVFVIVVDIKNISMTKCTHSVEGLFEIDNIVCTIVYYILFFVSKRLSINFNLFIINNTCMRDKGTIYNIVIINIMRCRRLITSQKETYSLLKQSNLCGGTIFTFIIDDNHPYQPRIRTSDFQDRLPLYHRACYFSNVTSFDLKVVFELNEFRLPRKDFSLLFQAFD